ncbi:hypothetical protein AGR6A_Cc190105 [Agrobacterium sp. NCPPB 925]|nr:hypothetical protein AGR6A_Cc190105 [Agrobacterium sp. NCPPB 925]
MAFVPQMRRILSEIGKFKRIPPCPNGAFRYYACCESRRPMLDGPRNWEKAGGNSGLFRGN